MIHNKIKAKIANNKASLCVQLHLTDPSVFELVSLLGFDGIWMDLEHHGYSVETAGQLIRAARVGGTSIVARPAKGEFARMGRLLELGAQTIMYPRCDGPAEATEVVRWSKFAPVGARGFDGSGPDGDYMGMSIADYVTHANRETMIIIQIEDEHALEKAEAIAATPGVDAIMLGPADFSILHGFPGVLDHTKIQSGLDQVARAARNAGKHWAATVGSPQQTSTLLEMGCKLVFHGADIVLIKQGLRQIQMDFRSLGFQFSGGAPAD